MWGCQLRNLCPLWKAAFFPFSRERSSKDCRRRRCRPAYSPCWWLQILSLKARSGIISTGQKREERGSHWQLGSSGVGGAEGFALMKQRPCRLPPVTLGVLQAAPGLFSSVTGQCSVSTCLDIWCCCILDSNRRTAFSDKAPFDSSWANCSLPHWIHD